MKKHRTVLLRFATNLASREAGFVFALLGVIVQACHTWFLAYDLSSLPGIWRTLQAGLMAIFISAALLYFTLKSSDEDSKQARKYRKIVWWFACVETFINLYYWGDHLLIQPWPNPDYGSFIIAIPFSILLPFVLKSYGSEVRTEDYSELDEEEHVDIDQLNNDLDNLIADTKKEEPVQQETKLDDINELLGILQPAQDPEPEVVHEDPDLNEDPEPDYKPHKLEYPEDPEPDLTPEEIDAMLQEEYEQQQQEEIHEENIPSEEEIQAQEKSVEQELEIHDAPVIDAKGNDARDTEEPKVVRPSFSSKPREQIVSIQNGAYTTTPAYVAEKKY